MKNTSDNFQCHQCLKRYSQERSLAVHIKTKHRNADQSQKYQSLKLKFSSETFLKAEEEILLFLSQLSDKHAYSLENLLALKIYDPVCHSAGKNHFVINPIIKNPFECQDPEEEIKQKINLIINFDKVGKNPSIQTLINDIQSLNSVLDQQYTKWFFADPYDDSIDFNDQFTLDDIPKLVKNCIKRKIELNHIPACIFVLWMAKYLKNHYFIDIWKIVSFLQDSMPQVPTIKQRQETTSRKMENKSIRNLPESLLKDRYEELELKFSCQEFIKWVQLYSSWHEKISELMEISKGKN